MPGPDPIDCEFTGCAYRTPPNCPTWELMFQFMQHHCACAHQVPVLPAAGAATARLERLPRPTFTLNMTEASWEFKILEWRSYIGQATTTPDSKLHQLQAACDEEFRQRVFDSGDYGGLDTEDKFLARMKELAVIKIHKSVHLRNLYLLTQDSDEAIRAFVARVNGTADMCG